MTELSLIDYNVTTLSEHKRVADKYFTEIFGRLPENTRRSYLSDLKQYSQYCLVNGYPGLTPDIVSTESSIKSYVTSMCESQLSYNTIVHRISTLSKFMAIAQLPDPLKHSEYLRDFIKLEMRDHDIYNRAKQAPALRLRDLEYINDMVIPETLLDIRDLAIINMMFDALLRADEVSSVQLKHIDHKTNKLLVPTSKADQTGTGSFRYLSKTTLNYVADYIYEANLDKKTDLEKLNGDQTKITKGILFRALSPKGTSVLPFDESVTRIKDMKRLDYTSIYRVIKRLAKKSGLDIPISGHSQRVGAAVTMAEQGIMEKDIQKAGAWKSRQMVAKYTEQANVESGMSKIADIFDR